MQYKRERIGTCRSILVALTCGITTTPDFSRAQFDATDKCADDDEKEEEEEAHMKSAMSAAPKRPRTHKNQHPVFVYVCLLWWANLAIFYTSSWVELAIGYFSFYIIYVKSKERKRMLEVEGENLKQHKSWAPTVFCLLSVPQFCFCTCLDLCLCSVCRLTVRIISL